jgi:hypothetical protein
MKKVRVILFSLLVLAIGWSCSKKGSLSIEPSTYVKNKTYAWVKTPAKVRSSEYNRVSNTKAIELDIKSEIDNELKTRGFVIDTTHPDFIVSAKAILEKQDNTSSTEWARSAGKGLQSQNGAAIGSSGTDMSPFAGNRTIINIQFSHPDSVSYTLWAGEKTKLVGEASTLTGSLEKDISDIFKKFPVKKSKHL